MYYRPSSTPTSARAQNRPEGSVEGSEKRNRAAKVHWWLFFFFFQAEDGIRDLTVTGVQTCALPIFTLLLVVDQSGSCQFGRPYTKAGLAVEVAAVLALAAARHNDRVGALMFADKVEYVVRASKGRPHALRIIRDLVAFTPRGRGTHLGEALGYAAKLPKRQAIVAGL